MHTLLKQYAKIDEQYRKLTESKEMLRDAILQELHKEKIDKVDSDFGSFTISSRKSWTYTEAVKKIEERLKLKKIQEEQKGIAQASVTEYLLFKKPNHE